MHSRKDGGAPVALQVISPLHKAIRQLEHCLGERSRELGVRGADAHLLAYVGMYGPCPLTELRRVFGHRPSTLTSLLDRLEGHGWIERRTDSRDRRGVLVQVTSEGRSLGRRARGLAEGLEAEIRTRVRPGDLEGFRRVLAALTEVSGFEPRGEA